MNKIPIKNIYYMICYAWDILEASSVIHVDADTYEQDVDLMATLLISGFNYQKRRGFIRSYSTQNEELSLIKGKINFSDSLKKSSFPRAKATCVFDNYTIDVLPNQIIKSSLQRLLRSKNIRHDIALEIRDIVKQLSEVEDRLDFLENEYRSVKIPRNYSHYIYLLSLAEFVNKNLSQNENSGRYEFTDFVREPSKLAELYEKFVRNFYKKHLAHKFVVSNTSQEKYDGLKLTTEASQYVPTLNTDIELACKTSGSNIIIDTKFSYQTLNINPFGQEKINSKYLMQLMTYLENRRRKNSVICSGMLLYPTVGSHYEFTNKIWDYKVSIFNIDLSKDWKEIHSNLIKIIDNHLAFDPEGQSKIA